MATKPLVVIAGPTASGKTALAIELAAEFDGEVICADSRTVYRGMDIGTAKPTKQEQEAVQHWGLDLVEPNERFTAADFKQYATERIADIRSRGKVPFLVGGTGLYIDAVIFDYEFGPEPDKQFRQHLETLTVEQLQKYCNDNNIMLPENYKNKRYLIRAIEQKNINNKRRTKPLEDTIIVGIATERDVLRNRIAQRAHNLFTDGVIEEAERLGEKYGWDHESMTGNIYPLCREYLEQKITLEDLKQRFVTLDWRLAKRQITWLKRNPFIKWMSLKDAKKYILSVLDSEH